MTIPKVRTAASVSQANRIGMLNPRMVMETRDVLRLLRSCIPLNEMKLNKFNSICKYTTYIIYNVIYSSFEFQSALKTGLLGRHNGTSIPSRL